ncbi:hypothetical protein TR80_009515 [Xanthomonas campestris]|uniref:DUF7696 family protein n=1 Tax=Xanthomonas campestris TaxID=339 RepID=UPI000CDAD8D8|nr:hypothetical protein [Xanthomonas campestris]TXD43085.1 hypothetical protein TR80_009515 [Xanthomonas campestris]
MTDDATEQQRRACEARHYLRQGYTDRASVTQLLARITQQLGVASATALHQEMRRQWECRAQWQQEQTR